MPELLLLPYNARWPDQFLDLASPIRRALGALALRIDHIGSTAIPGLAAKDVIDMQVTVEDLDSVVPALVGLGYELLPIRRDHLPPGAEGPPEGWEKRLFCQPPEQRRANLHVRRAGSANQRYALLFRDYLRAHAPAAAAYGLIKRALVRLHPSDWDAYYDVKDPACDLIWIAAEEWANISHWQPGPSDS